MNNQDEFYIPPPDPNAPKAQYDLITEGLHPAVCCQIHNVGHQSFKGGPPGLSPKCVLIFEVDQKMASGTMQGKPMTISKGYPMFMGNNAKGVPSALKTHMQGWRGRPFTDAELADFSLKRVLGKPCTLMIAHTPKEGGGMKATIVSILPPTGPGWVPTYTETPQWVKDEKARQVSPPGSKPAASGQAGGDKGYPADW